MGQTWPTACVAEGAKLDWVFVVMPEVCPFHEEVVEGVKETARGTRGLQTS